MNSYGSSEDHQPITWVRGYPLYAAHAIVVVYVLSMIATAILMASGAQGFLNGLIFDSSRVLRGEVWRVFSYGFYNPPSLWFAIEMVMIVWFGRELEKFFGRAKFLTLFAGLYFAQPLVLTVVGLAQPTFLAGRSGAFGIFIAFATLYPNVAFFLNILAKWLAIILVGIYSLMALSNRDTAGLISLWTSVGFAYAFIRHHQGHFSLPKFRIFQQRPPRKSSPRSHDKSPPVRSAAPSSMAEVDALLDKIAASGIGSLTPQERARLDAAQNEMKKRGRGR